MSTSQPATKFFDLSYHVTQATPEFIQEIMTQDGPKDNLESLQNYIHSTFADTPFLEIFDLVLNSPDGYKKATLLAITVAEGLLGIFEAAEFRTESARALKQLYQEHTDEITQLRDALGALLQEQNTLSVGMAAEEYNQTSILAGFALVQAMYGREGLREHIQAVLPDLNSLT